MSLAFDFGPGFERKTWSQIPIEDPRAAEVYDRHYSRQTQGAKGIVAPGERFLLWHDGPKGAAIWAVVRNRFRKQWFWRNSIFRNESGTLSSFLIREATATTLELWPRRYKGLPSEDLITEIAIDATATRRSRRHPPGICYLMAGWIVVRVVEPGHGRPARAVVRAARDPWDGFAGTWRNVGYAQLWRVASELPGRDDDLDLRRQRLQLLALAITDAHHE